MVNYNEYVYPQILHYGNERIKFLTPESAEYFKFTINSGDDSSYILPLSGGVYRSDMLEYNLLVDWGDGTEEIVSGTSSSGQGVTHTYSSANTNYQITISPNGDLDGWGGAFGYAGYDGITEENHETGCNTTENREKLISLDSPFTKSMVMKETSTVGVLRHVFTNCSNVTMGSEFNLPQDISGEVGDHFCRGLFAQCYDIKMNDIFQLPQGITKVGELFCSSMFQECHNNIMNDIFQLPPNISSVGDRFCLSMFYQNYSLQPNDIFQLPQNISSISTRFCYTMFKGTFITTGIQRFFGNLVFNQEQLDQWGVFYQTFMDCSSISEDISAETIPQLLVIPSSNNYCFTNASDIARQNCPVNWGGLLS